MKTNTRILNISKEKNVFLKIQDDLNNTYKRRESGESRKVSCSCQRCYELVKHFEFIIKY